MCQECGTGACVDDVVCCIRLIHDMCATGVHVGRCVCIARCKYPTAHSKQASAPYISVYRGTYLHNNTRSELKSGIANGYIPCARACICKCDAVGAQRSTVMCMLLRDLCMLSE